MKLIFKKFDVKIYHQQIATTVKLKTACESKQQALGALSRDIFWQKAIVHANGSTP